MSVASFIDFLSCKSYRTFPSHRVGNSSVVFPLVTRNDLFLWNMRQAARVTGACRFLLRSIRLLRALEIEYGTAINTGPSTNAAPG